MSKILIIEDELAIAELERDYLELSGFEVEIENTGDGGLKRALEEKFDLFILDLMLPGVDGFEICKRIRKVKNTPILMVSAKKEDIDKIRGLGLGADDYIEKPFSPGVLVARIRANLNQYARLKQGDRDKPLQAGGLTLDTRARRVFLDGQEVSLKNKEYELLWFFMRNPGAVFDRETLYERVWGLEAMGDSATVAVHINRLREKLGEQVIQTVRGAGYRFSGES